MVVVSTKHLDGSTVTGVLDSTRMALVVGQTIHWLDENGTVAHPYSTSAFLNAYPDFKASYEGDVMSGDPEIV